MERGDKRSNATCVDGTRPTLFDDTNPNLFLFDDLLILCCKEILINGLESKNIPTHMRPWMAMKILEYLPKSFIERIVFHMSENRECDRVMAIREDPMDKNNYRIFVREVPQKYSKGGH